MLFLISFNFPEVIENPKLKFTFPIIIGVPITVTNDAIDVLPLVAKKQFKIYQNS